MKCQYCGNEIPFGSKNCPACGAAAPQPPPPPPQPQPQFQRQYQQPQQQFQQQYQQPQPQFQQGMNYGGVVIPPGYTRKSRALYIVLALFLGGIGVHNFYAGYSGRGIAQLLITLFIGWLVIPLIFVGIWILLEIITISKDANGIPFE